MVHSNDGEVGLTPPLPKARTQGVVIQDMPDELLIYDLETHKAHCLNQTAALIWKQCDGKTNVADLAVILSAELNTQPDEDLVWLVLEQLSKARLLEERMFQRVAGAGISRRELVRRLGMGAALAVPLVISIVAPTAVSAQTCLANMKPCSPPGDNNACCSQCCSASSGKCINKGTLGIGNVCSVSCACRSGNCVNGVCAP